MLDNQQQTEKHLKTMQFVSQVTKKNNSFSINVPANRHEEIEPLLKKPLVVTIKEVPSF